MSDNVIPISEQAARAMQQGSGHARAIAPDRNVAFVESILAFARSHPNTQADSDTALPGMPRQEAILLAAALKLGLDVCSQGPHEFEAWASKDLVHFEQWLRHYQKQITAELDDGPSEAWAAPED